MKKQNEVSIKIKRNLPDQGAYINRFTIRGESGNEYIVAQQKNLRYWTCGCKGWIFNRNCKHLDAMGLPGFQVPFEPLMARKNERYQKMIAELLTQKATEFKTKKLLRHQLRQLVA